LIAITFAPASATHVRDVSAVGVSPILGTRWFRRRPSP
jgi:hypothetical protein